MESLVKSLLGKDQEHVYATTIIENAEKSENIEIELEEVKPILNHVEDETEQNKKKVKDLKNDVEVMKDTNEELVEELERKEVEDEERLWLTTCFGSVGGRRSLIL